MSSSVALVPSLRRPSWRVAWRARRLTKERTRQRLADGLMRAVAEADAPTQSIGSSIPVRRRAVVACRRSIVELAERLRAPSPVYAQGVSLVHALLSDPNSPLYQTGADLHGSVARARAALDGHLG